MSQKHHAPSLAVTVLLVVSCGGQDDPPVKKPVPVGKPIKAQQPERQQPERQQPERQQPTTQRTGSSKPPSVVFRRDRGMVVARVNGQDITVEDIVRRIDRHSYKGYLKLAEGGHLDRTLSSARLVTWARQFADRRALELTAGKRKLAPNVVNGERKALATKGFLDFFENYKQAYQRREGRKYPESPGSVASLRRRYLLEHGLHLERQAWLNVLVPDKLTQEQADWYLRTQPQIFNGYLDICVITINNRDARTGALFKGPAGAEVTRKIQDIQSRLEEDGSNFEKVAAKFSDVAKERERAGVYSNISRFDPRLPAAICRLAWGLRNGKWKGPVASPFGLHFVKRIRYLSKSMVVRLKADVPEVRRFIRQLRQENMLFDSRREQKVELVY
jgi:hypothetical protein